MYDDSVHVDVQKFIEQQGSTLPPLFIPETWGLITRNHNFPPSNLMDDHQQVEDYFVSRMGKTNLETQGLKANRSSKSELQCWTGWKKHLYKRGPIWKLWANMSGVPPKTKNMEEFLVDLGATN